MTWSNLNIGTELSKRRLYKYLFRWYSTQQNIKHNISISF